MVERLDQLMQDAIGGLMSERDLVAAVMEMETHAVEVALSRALAYSTMRPPYITATSSATAACR